MSKDIDTEYEAMLKELTQASKKFAIELGKQMIEVMKGKGKLEVDGKDLQLKEGEKCE